MAKAEIKMNWFSRWLRWPLNRAFNFLNFRHRLTQISTCILNLSLNEMNWDTAFAYVSATDNATIRLYSRTIASVDTATCAFIFVFDRCD